MGTVNTSYIGWSHNGRYLAFSTIMNSKQMLFLWNGKEILDITSENMPTHMEIYGKWSHDGRLAITVWNENSDLPEEIYLWDGESTHNLSQNPNSQDLSPTWSKDNRLAFLSEREGDYVLLIWDDVISEDMVASTDALFEIDLNGVNLDSSSHPHRTEDDSIIFHAQSSQDGYRGIYRWNGSDLQSVGQYPNTSSAFWTDDNYWSVVDPYHYSLIVRDADDNVVFETVALPLVAWSSTSELIFCSRGCGDNSAWILYMWTQTGVVEITHGNYIVAEWQSGRGTICFNG